jgi:sugar diacid utilization regulator
MGITVAQALKIGGLRQGRLLAGARNLDQVIENVNVIEALTDADWETGWDVEGQLLLTTFHAAQDDAQKQARLVELFARKGCAAIVFQRGILPHLSPAAIQRAEELGLPLIEVPEAASYPSIIMPLVAAILHEKSLALDLAEQKAALEAERRLQRDFMEDLLGEGYHSVEAISARARSLGWELQHKRVVVLVDLNCFERYYLSHLEQGEEHFQQIKGRFLAAVSQVVAEYSPQSIVVDRSDSIILLPHFAQETPAALARQEVQALAEAIHSRASQELGGLTISVAIGGSYDSVEGLCHSHREAKATLDAGRRIVQSRPILWYDDMALYVLLGGLASQPDTRRWLAQTLGPLLEYDKRNSTEMVRTLETYFDSNQRVQPTARRLGIHPKTLQYRLRRIAEILGTDPFCNERQLQFYLATKLARLL